MSVYFASDNTSYCDTKKLHVFFKSPELVRALPSCLILHQQKMFFFITVKIYPKLVRRQASLKDLFVTCLCRSSKCNNCKSLKALLAFYACISYISNAKKMKYLLASFLTFVLLFPNIFEISRWSHTRMLTHSFEKKT